MQTRNEHRSTARRSNTDRILAWAKLGHPVRQRDWMGLRTPDGGVPIMRVAVAIGRLEKRGHTFDHRTFGSHGEVEYRLVGERVEVPSSPAPAVTPAEQDALFVVGPAPFWERDR